MIDSQAVAWALIHSIWQGLLAAFACWSVITISRSARLRYVAGLAAMALMLAMFVITLAMSVPETAKGTPGQFAHPGSSFSSGDYPRMPLIAPADPIKHLAPYLSVLWIAGVSACHLWQLAGLVWVRRLRKRGVLPVTSEWQHELRRLGQMVGVIRSISLFESVMVNTPIVVGHLRPLILVPAGLLARLPIAQIEAILLHELSHIRRCDYLVNLFQRWVEGVFFYHPAMWWISRVVRFEREACCDDMAAAACGNRHTYASALAALEDGRFISPAMAATGSSLRGRIERLLRENAPPGVCGVISRMTILVSTSALAIGGWQANRETPLPPPPIAVKEALTNQPSRTAVAAAAVLAQARPVAQRMAPAQQPLAIEGPYRKWLNEDVVYLITDTERAAFDRLKTDEERQMFIEQFWQRRNALTPSTSERSAKEEHFRRIAYANDRFAADVPGWKTDRGQVYIVWGPPEEIEAHPSAQGGRPSYEIWFYRGLPGGQSERFVFADVNNTGDYQLQTADNSQAVAFNRVLRWSVADPLNRFVTGLAEEHFVLRENGIPKPFTSFETPGSPTAIAVVSDADLPDLPTLSMGETVTQARTLEGALAQLQSSSARRKALIIVRGASGAGAGAIPGRILGVVADAPAVGKWIVEIANQYVASYRSDSTIDPELTVKPVQGMPPLRIAGPVR